MKEAVLAGPRSQKPELRIHKMSILPATIASGQEIPDRCASMLHTPPPANTR
jgi:hypothetical protein